jgi:rhamnosyl/mannosyltransferase
MIIISFWPITYKGGIEELIKIQSKFLKAKILEIQEDRNKLNLIKFFKKMIYFWTLKETLIYHHPDRIIVKLGSIIVFHTSPFDDLHIFKDKLKLEGIKSILRLGKFILSWIFVVPINFLLSKKIVLVSNSLKSEFQRFYFILWPFIKRKTLVITNPYIPKFKKKNLEKDIDIFFYGRIYYRKGLDVLIEALRILKNKYNKEYKVIIAGSGELLDYYKNLSKKYSLKVKFLGRVSDEKLENLLNKSKCVVIPSKWEASPLVPREIINLNIPIIISNIEAHKEILKEDYPLFFESENPEDLAKKIIDFFEKYRDINVSKYIKEKPKTVEEWIKEWMKLFI